MGGMERDGSSDSPRLCQLCDDKVSTQCWDQVHLWVFKRTNSLQWQVFIFQTLFFQTQWEKQAWSRKNGDDKAGDKEWVGGSILKSKSSKETETCRTYTLSFWVFLFMGIASMCDQLQGLWSVGPSGKESANKRTKCVAQEQGQGVVVEGVCMWGLNLLLNLDLWW